MINLKNRLKQTNQPIINIDQLAGIDEMNFCVIGKRGFGKTTLSKFILSKVTGKTIIIFDPLAEYVGAYSFEDTTQFLEHIGEHGLLKKIYVCRFQTDSEFTFLFEIVSKLENIFLVIEESDLFCNPHFIDPHFSQIIKYGRHSNNTYLAITRRTTEINNLVISQSHYVFSFRQSLVVDIDRLIKLGFTPNVGNLQKFQYEAVEI